MMSIHQNQAWLRPAFKQLQSGIYPLAVFLLFLPHHLPALASGLLIGSLHYLLMAGGFHWAMQGGMETRLGRLVVMTVLRLLVLALLLVIVIRAQQFLAPLALVLGIFWIYIQLLVREVFLIVRAKGRQA
jgi:hypothetical protein